MTARTRGIAVSGAAPRGGGENRWSPVFTSLMPSTWPWLRQQPYDLCRAGGAVPCWQGLDRIPASLRDAAAHPLQELDDRVALQPRPHAVPADWVARGGERYAPRGHRAQSGRGTVGSHVHDGRPVMTHLATGAPPPPFTLPNQDGRATSLSDFAGRHVLVWFFSRAFGRN